MDSHIRIQRLTKRSAPASPQDDRERNDDSAQFESDERGRVSRVVVCRSGERRALSIDTLLVSTDHDPPANQYIGADLTLSAGGELKGRISVSISLSGHEISIHAIDRDGLQLVLRFEGLRPGENTRFRRTLSYGGGPSWTLDGEVQSAAASHFDIARQMPRLADELSYFASILERLFRESLSRARQEAREIEMLQRQSEQSLRDLSVPVKRNLLNYLVDLGSAIAAGAGGAAAGLLLGTAEGAPILAVILIGGEIGGIVFEIDDLLKSILDEDSQPSSTSGDSSGSATGGGGTGNGGPVGAQGTGTNESDDDKLKPKKDASADDDQAKK